MRFHERCLGIKWRKGVKRPEKSNAIDLLASGLVPSKEDGGPEREDFERNFDAGHVPEGFSAQERKEWLEKLEGVAVSSDAFVSLPEVFESFTNLLCSSFLLPITSIVRPVHEPNTLRHQQAVRTIRRCSRRRRSLGSHLSSRGYGFSITKQRR